MTTSKKVYPAKPIKTVTGIVSYVSEVRPYEKADKSKHTLVNVDLKHDGGNYPYTQLVFQDATGEAAVKGFAYIPTINAWDKVRPALEAGKNMVVTATGAWEVKKWKNKDGSTTIKPSLNIFNFSDVALTTLPPLPWKSPNNPKAPAKAKAKKKA